MRNILRTFFFSFICLPLLAALPNQAQAQGTDKDQAVNALKYSNWLRNEVKARPEDNFSLIRVETDELNLTHYRYAQTYNGFTVEPSVAIVHVKAGEVYLWNGSFFSDIQTDTRAALTAQQALDKATANIGASTYMWQVPAAEAQLKAETGDADATYYPKANVVIWYDQDGRQAYLAYKFDVYASEPMSRNYVYIDAHDGTVLHKENRICYTSASNNVQTKYSGTQTIVTDSTGPASFRLHDATRGKGVNTYNLKNSYYNGTDFTDSIGAFRDLTGTDQYALDAHFGAEITYDFYKSNFTRNSLDNRGLAINGYVHYGTNFANAMWDGSRMVYGDGDGKTFSGPLTCVDVCGHEITHGLTQYTGGLPGDREGGSLNESFSDIMGAMIKRKAFPDSSDAFVFVIGSQVTAKGIRNMVNPKALANPDTYKGKNWDFMLEESHNNSTVQSHCFYLLIKGGSGKNDLGNSYTVNGIGYDKATAIAYRALTTYITPNSRYPEAAQAWIQAANDLYGKCSAEAIATQNAWYASGLGNAFEGKPDFSYIKQECSHQVSFTGSHPAANAVSWDFGDGSTSTQLNPQHTYTTSGSFTVTLKIKRCDGTSDSIVKTSLIKIDPTVTCQSVILPKGTGTSTATSCNGMLYDDGGPNAKYSGSTSSSVTIAPPGARWIRLHFISFDFGYATDKLRIFDGASTTSKVITTYSYNNLPATDIVSTTGALTIQELTDANTTYDLDGFQATWECIDATSSTFDNTGVHQSADLAVYPNPTNGSVSVNLQTAMPSSYELSLYNVVGELVYHTEQTSNQVNAIDLSGQAPGLYIVSIKSGTDTYQKKIQLMR